MSRLIERGECKKRSWNGALVSLQCALALTSDGFVMSTYNHVLSTILLYCPLPSPTTLFVDSHAKHFLNCLIPSHSNLNASLKIKYYVKQFNFNNINFLLKNIIISYYYKIFFVSLCKFTSLHIVKVVSSHLSFYIYLSLPFLH